MDTTLVPFFRLFLFFTCLFALVFAILHFDLLLGNQTELHAYDPTFVPLLLFNLARSYSLLLTLTDSDLRWIEKVRLAILTPASS